MFKIAPCSHEAAKYAVMNWHYSKTMPSGKLVKYGVWEDEKFIGAIIYGRGANNRLLQPYGLEMTEGCELVRIALTKHETPVSQIVSLSLQELKKTNPGLRLVVSYADPEQGHKGGIYQAMNWVYTGQSSSDWQYFFQGKWYHRRMLKPTGFGGHTVLSKLTNEQKQQLPKRKIIGKYCYVYPLDKAMRRQVAKLAKEYPHAVEGSKVSRTSSPGEV